ncbi:MAG: methyltransferase [Nocardioides sp.]
MASSDHLDTGTVSERRAEIRSGVVWAGLRGLWVGSDPLPRPARIVDIGGGTGGFAVRLAEEGHRVVVVEPSPDALAALGRRADERGVADRVTAIQGDLADLAGLSGSEQWFAPDEGPGKGAVGADLVLCHGVLEVVADPGQALATIHQVLRPGGVLSLLVAQRHAAVVARAMAGHFQQALALLDQSEPSGRAGHRFTLDELAGLFSAGGWEVGEVHAVRVFADLVPGSLLDSEPGAAQALAELEQAVCGRPEYLPLATQLHLLARA